MAQRKLREDLAALKIDQCLNSLILIERVFKEFDRICKNLPTELHSLLEVLQIEERNSKVHPTVISPLVRLVCITNMIT
jgi:hypothetical protein